MTKKIVTIVRKCLSCKYIHTEKDDPISDWCMNPKSFVDGDFREIKDSFSIPDWCPLEDEETE